MHHCEPLRLRVRRAHSYFEKRRPKQGLLACYKQPMVQRERSKPQCRMGNALQKLIDNNILLLFLGVALENGIANFCLNDFF